MIPLCYMDDTVRRRAEFAEMGNGASQSHASNQKMALVSFISRRRDSLRGGRLTSPILLPSFPGGADIRAELII